MSAPPSPLQLAHEPLEKHKRADIETSAVPVDTQDVFEEGDSGIDPVYQAKAHLLNEAIQEIGMGKYQVRLFEAVDQRQNPSHDASARSSTRSGFSGFCSSSRALGGSRQYSYVFRPCMRILNRLHHFQR